MDSKYKTCFPELLTDRFQLRRYFSSANPTLLGIENICQRNLSDIKQQVGSVIDAVVKARNVVGRAKWRTMGFEDLGTLARVVEESLLVTESERYHRLSWLRTWMFWLDLRQFMYGAEEHVLSGLFYVLLLAIVPLFPVKYRTSLRSVCMERIQASLEAFVDDPSWTEEAAFLGGIVSEEFEMEKKEMSLLQRGMEML